MNEKLKAFGQKIKDNAGAIIEIGIYSAITVGFVAIVVAAAKAEQREIEAAEAAVVAEKKMLTDAVSRRATVLPGPDGGYWIIENN